MISHNQIISETHFKVRLANSNFAVLAHADTKAVYDAASGTPEERRIVARDYMKTSLRQQLGDEDFERVFVECDFVPETGVPIMIIKTA